MGVYSRMIQTPARTIQCHPHKQICTLVTELQGTTAGKLVAVKCDVKKEEDIKATFEVAKKEFGGVDVCISNAGLAHNAPLLSGSTEDWRDMLEVNVLGLCICDRKFMTQLKERGVNKGHIFNMNKLLTQCTPP